MRDKIAEYFSSKADGWEQAGNRLQPAQGVIPGIAGITAGTRVLDVGCGTGVMMPVYLAAQAEQVVALDMAPRMIEIAQEKFHDKPTLDFRCENVYTFDDAEGFDAVVIYNAFPHFLDRAGLAKKVAELLRPRGRFVVAHSMGRETLNEHHKAVPQSVCSELRPVNVEAAEWEPYFTIDCSSDTPGFYCFAGTVRDAQ